MSEFWAGVAGVTIGGAIQFGFNLARDWFQSRKQTRLDDMRKDLLREALENPPSGTEWRKLTTLCGIIGAKPEETTRLLIELGARGSESQEDVWALLSERPLRSNS